MGGALSEAQHAAADALDLHTVEDASAGVEIDLDASQDESPSEHTEHVEHHTSSQSS